MKKVVPATEMTNADPTWLSLVDRGANRRPIQVVKQEGSTMPGSNAQQRLDLSAMINSYRAQATKADAVVKPSLQAIIVPAGQGEALKSEIEANAETGLPAVVAMHSDAESGLDFLLFSDSIDPEATTYTVGDTGLVVANVKKYVSTWSDSESFAENIAKSGLYSDIWNALNTADATIYNALDNSSTPEEALASVNTIVSELGTYLQGVIRALPTTAFKAEKVLSAYVAKRDAAPVVVEVVKTDEITPAVVDPVVAVDPIAVDPAVVVDTQTAETTPEAAPAPLTLDAIVAALGPVLDEKITALKGDLGAKVETVVETVTAVSSLAEKADLAVKQLGSTLVGTTADNPDTTVQAPAVKTESAPAVRDSWERA